MVVFGFAFPGSRQGGREPQGDLTPANLVARPNPALTKLKLEKSEV
jgi:hypothetical protein